jgi:hypothetical protein
MSFLVDYTVRYISSKYSSGFETGPANSTSEFGKSAVLEIGTFNLAGALWPFGFSTFFHCAFTTWAAGIHTRIDRVIALTNSSAITPLVPNGSPGTFAGGRFSDVNLSSALSTRRLDDPNLIEI